MASWLIYALGGGWGHLNRAIALGRRAAQQHRVRILTNSPYAGLINAQIQAGALLDSAGDSPSLELHILSANLAPAEVRRQIQEWVLNTEFDYFIVDTFPRGLGGELATCLPNLCTPKVLIHRTLSPTYIHVKNLMSWVAQQFDLVLIPGQQEDTCFVELPQAIVTEPWLMWNHHELSAQKIPRPMYPMVVISATGNPNELGFWGDLMIRLQAALPQVIFRCLAFQQPPGCPAQSWVRHWPGMTVLQQADVIVGGAGYNTVFEAVALGIPLITFPFKRRYDRQHVRAMRWTYPVNSFDEAIATLSVLLQTQQQERIRPQYVNGVENAVALIEALHDA